MKILIIGGGGTLGKKIVQSLDPKHEILIAGRTSGDVQVDITSEHSIRQLYEKVTGLDACVCVAASGAMDNFLTLTEKDLLENMKGKLFGQINLVLIGQQYLNAGGSFTLTSGVFGDYPAHGVTGGGMISGALHSFALSAALELKDSLRVNVVSPGMAEDSAGDYQHLFPDLKPVTMARLVEAYKNSIEGLNSGEIFRVY
ncbi:short chain dehydrogenase [Flavitalea flava]